MTPSTPFPRSFIIFSVVSFAVLFFLGIQYQPGKLADRSLNRDLLSKRDGVFLFPRDDSYTCSVDNPCSNGACCGASGYCGYGPTYCGTGCSSNCNATAECGQYASETNKTCPLNVCCSQYGFCGTTEDFCETGCQSNCDLNPQPSGSGNSNILQKVIGYYEGWTEQSSCHKVDPTDLPLDALTHLNFAFVYIDPDTYKLVPMDSNTSTSLFQKVADVKEYKSTLKIWMSVGGWSFSDNDTTTQPLFGDIAASETKRQTFANNVVSFMEYYGFDGLDIDWEYPGAPDRGGSTEDTDNYVSLLKTLRSTFDGSTRSLGLTFTAPTSYWYLRWFDVKNMMKYADWINFMTYDLHGVWDSTDAIGSIMQAHTNLTEIKVAAELLWRNDISPSDVVMGFGFYGRSFELADKSCSTPGCAFTGGGTAGPCSATSGIMEYYEIQAMLKQHPKLTPVHDEEAAVKYVVYDTNQWVSYDDATTFQQKVAWANSTGLGGAMIWASDTDDSNYTAHSGLTGKTLSHVDTTPVSTELSKKSAIVNTYSIAENLVGQNGQDCIKMSSCTDQDNTQASKCPSGYKKLGWERGKCGKKHAHSICCPSSTAPSSCKWRGSGGDCNGQCHVGEAKVMSSSWGGYPTESNQNKCSRGYKVFCCEANDWSYVTDGCRWTGCGGSCNDQEDTVIKKYESSVCSIIHPRKTYCCPSTSMLYDCRWVGSQPDCADAKCSTDEVTVALDSQGKSYASCSWGRKKTGCCKVRSEPAPKLTCENINLCDTLTDACSLSKSDGWSYTTKHDLDTYPVEDANITETDLGEYYDDEDGLDVESGGLVTLERRGKARDMPFTLAGLTAIIVRRLSRPYPSRGDLFNTRRARQIIPYRNWNLLYNRCDDTTVAGQTFTLTTIPERAETEHIIDLSVHQRFVRTANTGFLPSGQRTRTSALSTSFFRDTYFAEDVLASSLPRVSTRSRVIRSPYGRVFEALGSTTNVDNFVLTIDSVNAIKGNIFVGDAPMALAEFKALIEKAADGDSDSTERMIEILRETIAVFRYLQLEDISTRQTNIQVLVRNHMEIIESSVAGATGLTNLWNEFYPDFLTQVEEFAQEWVTNSISRIRTVYSGRETTPRNAASVLTALLSLERQISEMTIPGSKSDSTSSDTSSDDVD